MYVMFVMYVTCVVYVCNACMHGHVFMHACMYVYVSIYTQEILYSGWYMAYSSHPNALASQRMERSATAQDGRSQVPWWVASLGEPRIRI